MRIKRYFGKSIREAIQKVREEQGPDAVVLSNRKVDGGVEIVAAIDFDEVVLDADAPRADGGFERVSAPVQPQPRPELAAQTVPPLRLTEVPAVLARRRTTEEAAIASTATAPVAPVAPAAGAPTPPAAVRSAEPTLREMRRELKGLRDLMEQQLSGMIFGDVALRNPLQANLLRLLLRLELSPRLCQQILTELTQSGDARHAWRTALGVLAHKLPVTNDDILTQGGVVALVGPTGVGKTTTIAKLAARFAVRHGARRVALVTTDNYRIGAHEQLRAYAKILDAPLRIVGDHHELRETLQGFADRRLVLIDTAGMSQRDARLAEQFSLMRDGAPALRSYLVLAATTRESGLEETIGAYRALKPRACILTKVDEACSLGGPLSLIIKHQLPVAYVSDGQRVPEDLYTARAHSLVSRSVSMMRRDGADETTLAWALGRAVANG